MAACKDFDESENLALILSLDEHQDAVTVESDSLEECQTFEVREIISVLRRLAESPEACEAKLASQVLSRADSDSSTTGSTVKALLNEFAKEVNEIVASCYTAVASIKNKQVRMVKLEREFLRQRSDKQSKLVATWRNLVGDEECAKRESTIVFQHVLQHIWSYAVLRVDDDVVKAASNIKVCGEDRKREVDEVERIAIRHHAGWAIKRARDTIVSTSKPIRIKMSKTDSEEVELLVHDSSTGAEIHVHEEEEQ
ncbi:uncharacterized protein LOC144663293 [Oculina patagonica]